MKFKKIAIIGKYPAAIDSSEMNSQLIDLIEYLSKLEETKEIIHDISSFLSPRIKKYALQGRKYLAIGFGCTGGRHRSVFMTEEIANIIKNTNNDLYVSTFHREINV